jgi:hypothetical protein
MAIIHIKIVDGQQKRLLEIMQPHDLRKDNVVDFLDEIEKLIERFFGPSK